MGFFKEGIGGGGGGSTTLDGLTDTDITAAAKGDLLVFNGTDWVDVTVGANGQVLVADSAEVSGVKWAAGSIPVLGTFTPALADNSLSDSEGQTYTTQTGSYVKVGDLVHVQIHIEMLSLGTLTTSEIAQIIGLPFASHASYRSGLSMTYGASLAIGAGEYITASIAANTSHASLRVWDATTGPSNGTVAMVSANGRIELAGSYIAA